MTPDALAAITAATQNMLALGAVMFVSLIAYMLYTVYAD